MAHLDSSSRSNGLDLILKGYKPRPGNFDEMMDRDGRVREHWRPFLRILAALGPEEIDRRFAAADRHLRELGVFYRVYEDPAGSVRPWPFSHVPLLIAPGEWRSLKAGLVQRAELLERILQDIYGPADLVRERRLPAAVVAGNPEFLRPMVGVNPVGGAHLRFCAVDVGRSPDGRWWVLGDRTQAPSGAGYALENRIALSHAMPDAYRELRVERLAPFFQAFQAELSSLNRQDDSRVCVLTPGPLNETYFEHAYLARYLGFLLVEGEDLTVREDGVFIRTVSGLKRAEVLLRRLDSDFADPLELSARSRLGVPGLMQAVRDGTVAVANSLGAGAVEARAMLSFTPASGAAAAGRGPRDPEPRDMVAGRSGAPRRGPAETGQCRHWLGLHGRPAGPCMGRCRGRPRKRAGAWLAAGPRRSHRAARCGLRRTRSRDTLDHAGLAQRPTRAASLHPAADAGAGRRGLGGHAGRLRAGRRRRRCACRQSPAGWTHRGCLDVVGQAGRRSDLAAGAGPHSDQSRHRRASEPGGGQSVLARTLCGTHRSNVAPGACLDRPLGHQSSERRSCEPPHLRAAGCMGGGAGRHPERDATTGGSSQPCSSAI